MKERVYAVIGLGVFGMQLALSLAGKGNQVIAIDNDDEAIEKIKGKVTQAILVDTTEASFLSRVPMDNVDTTIVATSHFDTSALTVAFLKQAGVPHIIARAETSMHAMILKKIGADEVIIVEVEQGLRLAQLLSSPDILDTMPLSKMVSLAEIAPTSLTLNKPIKDIDLRNRFGLNIVAIRRSIVSINELGAPEKIEQVVLPTPNEIVVDGDILIVVGSNDSLEQFKEL